MRWTRLRSAWHEALVVCAEHGDGVFDFGEHIAEAGHETRQDALHVGGRIGAVAFARARGRPEFDTRRPFSTSNRPSTSIKSTAYRLNF